MPCDRPGCSQPAPSQCSRCGCKSYCSRACQKADWGTHKPLCNELSEVRTIQQQWTLPAAAAAQQGNGARLMVATHALVTSSTLQEIAAVLGLSLPLSARLVRSVHALSSCPAFATIEDPRPLLQLKVGVAVDSSTKYDPNGLIDKRTLTAALRRLSEWHVAHGGEPLTVAPKVAKTQHRRNEMLRLQQSFGYHLMNNILGGELIGVRSWPSYYRPPATAPVTHIFGHAIERIKLRAFMDDGPWVCENAPLWCVAACPFGLNLTVAQANQLL